MKTTLNAELDALMVKLEALRPLEPKRRELFHQLWIAGACAFMVRVADNTRDACMPTASTLDRAENLANAFLAASNELQATAMKSSSALLVDALMAKAKAG